MQNPSERETRFRILQLSAIAWREHNAVSYKAYRKECLRLLADKKCVGSMHISVDGTGKVTVLTDMGEGVADYAVQSAGELLKRGTAADLDGGDDAPKDDDRA
jgi:hypothetical protein